MAFDRLVRKYNRMAGAIAYAIVGEFNTAEDIVQDAFLKAYRKLGSLRDRDKFKIWFAGIVRSGSIDCLRRRKAQRTLPFSQVFEGGAEGEERMGPRPVGSVSPVEELYDRKEIREKVLEAIRTLPQEDRVVVTLKHMEGFSYREISQITGTSTSSVESRLFRARRMLRRKLDRVSSPGEGRKP